MIHLDDQDVPKIEDDDFIEDEGGPHAKQTPDRVHIDYFIRSVQLFEVTGEILSRHYSIKAKHSETAKSETHCAEALASWLQSCETYMRWRPSAHRFWPALLSMHYYTNLLLLHRIHVPKRNAAAEGVRISDEMMDSIATAHHAAAMITSIIEKLIEQDELRFTPAFV